MNLPSEQSPDALQRLTSEQSTGQSLLEHLKKIDGWYGNDLKECLQLVYDNRGPITVKALNSLDTA